MANEIFFHRIKHSSNPANNGAEWDKGIEVKAIGTADENFAAAKQSYHAYLGAYAYNKDSAHGTDFVSCMITDRSGTILEPFHETWGKAEEPQPEPEPEPEEEPEEEPEPEGEPEEA